jgi:hypothetical protein
MFDHIKKKIKQDGKKTVNPTSRWQTFSNKTSLDKSTTDYLESISGVGMFSDSNELEAMVRNQLNQEFPGIDKKKSYELLVDAVKNNIMKKQLQAGSNNLDIEK